ncbi:bifunctional 2-polyprenyl-6-hydroxyphenol methylase/3-demethylubiquinol 3-O-methyltransferase UbiG [Leptolyngbya ohadii]|uniref:bifunctional 2-polyprenyl-6-hydroxyphenol methylase/3-demethylubiquinol 3-O-methyltransferase UbiG n=1 Tax=Leptolyngbya ohadii TaxID=1962290 RepID=UPI000B59B1D7|nr:bifunctional 2-polyprenyl-6-hydroxyphenol methylase/3-demethylubiquinol 3-O-methyltransferase UbiG [Leptolyngbya ohadii]
MRQRNDLDFYNRVAEEWWCETAKIYALSHLNPARFQYFDRHIPSWSGLKVLDVGCGGGFSCEFMARRGAIVSGIDQSNQCIETARKHAAANHFAIDYRHGYAEQLPYADRSFDAVVCVDVLEHVADLGRTIAEIHRVLKPGGIFCFDTINRTLRSRLMMIWLLEDLMRQIPQGIHDWQKFIQPEELRALMRETGFAAIEFCGFNVLGETVGENIAAYRHYRRTGAFKIRFSDNLSVMYIGIAKRLSV